LDKYYWRKKYKLYLGKWYYKREKKKKRPEIGKNQLNLWQFIVIEPQMMLKNPKAPCKLPYNKTPELPNINEYMEGKLTKGEIVAYSQILSHIGYLKDLFLLNNWCFWDQIQLTKEQKDIFGRHTLKDIVKLEVGRCKRAVIYFNTWIEQISDSPKLLKSFNLDYEEIPSAHHYSQMVGNLNSTNVLKYFYLLRDECIEYELVDFKVGGWDCRFFKSDCSNNKNKETKMYGDPEAGPYKHIKKFFGVGYIESRISDLKNIISLDFLVYPANKSQNHAYTENYLHYLDLGLKPFKWMFADSAAYSIKNLEFTASHGTVPFICAKKNIKEFGIKVTEHKYLNGYYIHPYYYPSLKKMIKYRPITEHTFLPDADVYNRKKMSNRGLENAKIYACFTNITNLLTTLTAYKVRRLDLIGKPTSFRKIS